jgi:hypothetical protein
MAKKNPNYLQNFANEINQSYQAWHKAVEASGDINPGANARARAANAARDAAEGQVWGALLQGRRYDTNGKQIKKK